MKYSFIKVCFYWNYFLFIVLLGVFGGFVTHSLLNLRGIKKLEKYTPAIPTKIVDIKGRTIAQFYAEKRELIEFNELPLNLVNATLSTEDKRFLEHYGISPWRIMKALWVDLLAMRAEQGGSTITVQLSKLLFLNHKRTLTRKIKELWYAVQIEKQYSKKEILLFYFNQMNYGHGCYGVEVASKFFLKKAASELDLMESALIAGIPNSPVYYSPIRYVSLAMKRHYTVLYRMKLNGKLSSYKGENINLAYHQFWNHYTKDIRPLQENVSEITENHAPYFVEYIRRKLENEMSASVLYRGGLTIHTTLNLDHQRSAQKHLWQQLRKQNNIYHKIEKQNRIPLKEGVEASLLHWTSLMDMNHVPLGPTLLSRHAQNTFKDIHDFLQLSSLFMGLENVNAFVEGLSFDEEVLLDEDVEGSLISIEPHTGYITAMVGGSGFHYTNQFNRTLQIKRQGGSIIKPFIYACAMDNHLITAGTILNDKPSAFGNEINPEALYIPKNYSGKYHGHVSARTALKRSINICAVKVLDQIGLEPAREYASRIFRCYSRADIDEKFPSNYTMVLGTGLFSPLSIATAYAVLANEGVEVIPKSIRYITDVNGETVRDYEAERRTQPERQVMTAATAYILYSILSDVFKPGGTAYKPDLLDGFIHWRYSAGKTGTSSRWKDAWFMGINKYLSTCVWMGYDSGISLGKHGAGGVMSAPVWIEYQKDALKAERPLPIQKPETVIKRKICRYTGLLAGPFSKNSDLIYEYYKKGSEPTNYSRYRLNTTKEEMHFKSLTDPSQAPDSDIRRFMDIPKEN